VRMKYDPATDKIVTSTEQVLLTGILRNKFHDGGRLRFSPDGQFLFASTGDAQNGNNAQNKNGLNGKILRIKPDGSIPSDNPFGSCSGITITRDVLYVACERGTRLYREVISGSSLTNVQQFFNGTYGRLRTVEPAPDGGMWMTTSNGDKDSTPNNSSTKVLHV